MSEDLLDLRDYIAAGLGEVDITDRGFAFSNHTRTEEADLAMTFRGKRYEVVIRELS